MSSPARASSGPASPAQLHDGPHGLSHVGMGDADDGDVGHRRVHHEHVLDLAGVHVDAARDDHVRHPVGEVEVAVLVDPSDVAQRAPAPLVERGGRLGRVAVVLEPVRGLEPDLALLARRQLGAVGTDDVGGAEQRPTDRAGMGEPLVGPDGAEPHALAARVVLVHDRAQPLERGPLHLGRAGRRRVHDDLQARQVEPSPLLGRQLHQPHEVRGHELGVGDPVTLDQLEHLERVEPLHDDGGPAQAVERRRPPGGGGVVERCRAQVHAVLAAAVQPLHQHAERAIAPPSAPPTCAGFTPLGRPVVPDE